MAKEDHLYVTRPCSGCPFRKSCLSGWLGSIRVENINESESFVCHTRTDAQCSGHMQLNGNKNVFVRVAESIGMELKLEGRGELFDTTEAMVHHHSHCGTDWQGCDSK